MDEDSEMTAGDLARSDASIRFISEVCDGLGPLDPEQRDAEVVQKWQAEWDRVLEAYDNNVLAAVLGVLRDTAYGLTHHHIGVGYIPGTAKSYGFAPLPDGLVAVDLPITKERARSLAAGEMDALLQGLAELPAIKEMAESAEFQSAVRLVNHDGEVDPAFQALFDAGWQERNIELEETNPNGQD